MFGWTTPTPRLDASTSTFVGITYLIHIYMQIWRDSVLRIIILTL